MLALYRKYRPKTLSEVVAQPQVTEPLSNSLKTGKLSHSYLFTGPRGCGKTSVARILAHEINNFKYELEDSYLDIIEIDAASNTGVDNIRDLREKAMIAPSEGKYKVYIIDEVHMLSKSAFNALLKTLEEPPEHVVFILATTDLEKVPVTITSRSQIFRFRLVAEPEMFDFLKSICKKEKIKISDPALKIIVSRGGGSFRDSLSLLDQISSLGNADEEISEAHVASVLGLPLDSKLTDLLEAYASGDFVAVSAQLKSLLMEGLKPELIAERLIEKIVSSPSPNFLPLLEKLPSVTAPFPEAKLLLAMLGNIRSAEEGNLRTSKTFSKEHFSSPSGFDNISSTKASSQGVTTRRSSRSLNEDVVKTTRSEENRSEEKAFDDSSISALPPALSQQLKQCKILEEGNIIHIYPQKKITKTILERKNNSDVLRAHFDKEFVIHELDELEKSPELTQISDIMGNIEEVNQDANVPF